MIGISRMANRAKYILLKLVSSKIICLFLNFSLEGETHGDWGCHVKQIADIHCNIPLHTAHQEILPRNSKKEEDDPDVHTILVGSLKNE